MANNFQLILLPLLYIVDYVCETNVWCMVLVMAIKLGLANFDEIIKRGQIKMSLCTACVCTQREERERTKFALLGKSAAARLLLRSDNNICIATCASAA